MRIFTLISACLAMTALSIGRVIDAVADFSLNLLPRLHDARPHMLFDNGHPRSPLRSLRLGLA